MSRRLLASALLVFACLLAAVPALAKAAGPGDVGGAQWNLTMVAWPTVFAPGAEKETYIVAATNVGGAATSGVTKFGVQLAVGLSYEAGTVEGSSGAKGTCVAVGQEVTCESNPEVKPGEPLTIDPGEQLISRITVKVDPAATGTLQSQATVSEGGAGTASSQTATPVGTDSAAAGIAPGSFFSRTSTSQAGAHPNAVAGFTITTTRHKESNGLELIEPAGSLKEVLLESPPGLIGSASATPKCDFAQFASNDCPASSQVGIESLILNTAGGGATPGGKALFSGSTPVYNLTPPAGVAAQFGFRVLTISVIIRAKVRSGGDYGLDLEVGPNSQGGTVFASTTMFYGAPANRNGSGETAKPMVYNPTACGSPQAAALTLGFYQTPARDSALAEPQSWSGCELVPFAPELAVDPTTRTADAPTGLGVELHLPQSTEAEGLSSAALRDATVTLPAGLAINPAAANGLGACTPSQFGLTTPSGTTPFHTTAEPAACPNDAKIGTVAIDTPLLDHPLPGAVYAAEQGQNPFGSLLAIYVGAHDPQTGVVVKLAGRVEADPRSGQLTATFADNPQLPFEDLRLDFFDGAGAVLSTPATCGGFGASSRLTPWSGTPAAEPGAAFAIDRASNGAPCPSRAADLPNAPGFEAGTVDPRPGAYSPFVLNLSRGDGSQRLAALTAELPEGLLAKLAGIPYCPDATLAGISEAEGTAAAQLAHPSCPAASQVGTVAVAAGVGPRPFHLDSGRAYLAGPYKGAPLSLAIVTPALAGPFDLGSVVVRTALRVDPESTRVTAVSDPLPTILHGIPLEIRQLRVNLDRPEFTRNPTDCEPAQVAATVTGSAGGVARPASRFQVAGCAGLRFGPRLVLRVLGKTNRNAKPRFRAVLRTAPGEANIARAQVNLPHSEFLEQGHIRTICTRVQFNAGAGHGAACPAGSIYGHARAVTPLLSDPLEGPVFLRSSSHKLPDLVAALDGQIDVTLAGRIDTGPNGGIRTTFDFVPDAPVSEFALSLKGGGKGLLVNSEDLCSKRAKTRAIVRFTGQNGKVRASKPKLRNGCRRR